MGKYMPKKSKITANPAVMEVVSSSAAATTTTLGVRTRAKTLALQRLNSSSSLSSPNGAPNPDAISLCYLQLRSRRLEKPTFFNAEATKKQQQQQTHKEKKREGAHLGEKGQILGVDVKGIIGGTEEGIDEASCGENNLEFEARDRSTRESTPCSLVRDLDNSGTPCSTTRQKSSGASYQRVQNDVQRHMPTTREMEEFFASGEQEQQRLFIEKYNFDIVNDLPLPGRYEWAKVSP